MTYSPSPELADVTNDDEIEAAETEAFDVLIEAEIAEIEADAPAAPEADTIPLHDLLLLGVEHRLGRIANALEKDAAIKCELTAQVARLADAMGFIALTFNTLTECVEGKDGETRCTIRTHKSSPNFLSFAGEEQ